MPLRLHGAMLRTRRGNHWLVAVTIVTNDAYEYRADLGNTGSSRPARSIVRSRETIVAHLVRSDCALGFGFRHRADEVFVGGCVERSASPFERLLRYVKMNNLTRRKASRSSFRHYNTAHTSRYNVPVRGIPIRVLDVASSYAPVVERKPYPRPALTRRTRSLSRPRTRTLQVHTTRWRSRAVYRNRRLGTGNEEDMFSVEVNVPRETIASRCADGGRARARNNNVPFGPPRRLRAFFYVRWSRDPTAGPAPVRHCLFVIVDTVSPVP